MKMDAHEVRAFAIELEKSSADVQRDIRPVVQKGALNIKQAFNDSFRGSTHFKGISGSVTFDTKVTAGGVEAEIGPDKSRHPGVPGPGTTRPAAPHANIAIFGGAYGGGGSVDDPTKHLDAEAPKFEKALGDVIRRALQ